MQLLHLTLLALSVAAVPVPEAADDVHTVVMSHAFLENTPRTSTARALAALRQVATDTHSREVEKREVEERAESALNDFLATAAVDPRAAEPEPVNEAIAQPEKRAPETHTQAKSHVSEAAKRAAESRIRAEMEAEAKREAEREARREVLEGVIARKRAKDSLAAREVDDGNAEARIPRVWGY